MPICRVVAVTRGPTLPDHEKSHTVLHKHKKSRTVFINTNKSPTFRHWHNESHTFRHWHKMSRTSRHVLCVLAGQPFRSEECETFLCKSASGPPKPKNTPNELFRDTFANGFRRLPKSRKWGLRPLGPTCPIPLVIGTIGPIPSRIGTKCPVPLGAYCASWPASPFAEKAVRLFCANRSLGHRNLK